MPKQITTDHGRIIHFAGAHHLFPVARRDDPSSIRLAAADTVASDEVRIGWGAFFRPFIDRGLVFLHDEAAGEALPRPVAEKALAAA